MMIDIRKAEPQDFTSLARLISNDIAWNRYGINYDIAIQLINSAEDEFYVACLNQEIVGFCALRLNGAGNIGAYMRMIVVNQAYRGKGIGSQLIAYAWDLVTKSMPNLFLICSTDNIEAQEFYKKLGFKEVGILDSLVVPGHDEILFWKSAGTLR